MIDYYSLYKNSLEAIGYHKLDTGVDLLQYLIATEEGKGYILNTLIEKLKKLFFTP
nr:hypothetical protein [Streptococcus equi]